MRIGAVRKGHIYVPAADEQRRRQQLFDPLGELGRRRESIGTGTRTALRRAASDHNETGPKVLLLVDALLMNLRTIKSRRQHAHIDGTKERVILLLYLCVVSSTGGKGAEAEQCQKDTGYDY